MNRGQKPEELVDNGKFLSRAVLEQAVVGTSVAPVQPVAAFASAASAGATPSVSLSQAGGLAPDDSPMPTPPAKLVDMLHHYSLALFALLFFAVGLIAIQVGGNYYAARVIPKSHAAKASVHTIAGLNLTVPAKDLQSKLQTITNQPATLTVGSQTVPISADTIKGWLQITSSKDKSEYYVRIKAGAISDSLKQLANQFVKAPVNQVTVTEDGVNKVVVAGSNGASLTDPNSLKAQADQVAKTVMDGKGLSFSTPLQTQPFQSVTPAAFDKLLVANVTTKKLWVYQNGQLINTWLISAGAPATPTPLGEYHVYAKYAVQDMWGYGPGHKYYFQPHVRWISYFYQGSAVHGVYWHPLSWFGAINSSHGCIGLPENEAEWVFNWDSIGTTVIVNN